MRFIRKFFIIALIIFGGFFLIDQAGLKQDDMTEQNPELAEEKSSRPATETSSKEEVAVNSSSTEAEIPGWIGKTTDELVESYGEPIRKDPSAYGYVWWVYTNEKNEYIQFGVEDSTVTTIYAAGDAWNFHASYEALDEQFGFENEVTYSDGLSSYTFRLNSQDMTTRPLVKLNDKLFMQLYFDTFTNQLSSVRLVTADNLLKMRPYGMEYRGELPERPDLTDEEWKQVESGMEEQIFDITNVLRNQYSRPALKWEESVHHVAYQHSKDMDQNDYFSHTSLNGDGLKERLRTQDVFYLGAGENIAAHYPDAPAAMNGWLNSEGHREALLNESYTHLGVGVYRLFYTQNFLMKP